jgi:NitT/TauT family transport system substrate-binding protein
MPQNLEALGRGEIDVAQLFEPYASMAVRRGVGVILHAASRRGLTSYTTLLATRAGFARLRTELACMERAIGRTQAWLYQHSAAELAALVAPYFKGVAPDDLASALGKYQDAGLWARSTRISRAGFERLALSLRSGGFILRAPAYDDCVADCSHEVAGSAGNAGG